MVTDVFDHMAMHLMSVVFVFAMGFMLFDIVTGLIQAVANKRFSSEKMREGFFHKMAIILILMVAVAIDSFISGEFGDIGITAPIFDAACVYIIIMETSSILENIAEMNPGLRGTKLMELFAGVRGKDREARAEDAGVTVEIKEEA